ncbi:alpha/beta hydrolase [Pediococcus parvulus]|uniref:alpha/beta hydrolase n=1 Tax=Pediococcus parvulus TaxID=54062 RepID=UPI00345E2813
MKRKNLIGLGIVAPVALGVSALTAASAKLYDYAFRRVDYVPETSADKQKYADDYYRYVNWFHKVTTKQWTLHPSDLENRVEATFIPSANENAKTTVIIAHGYKGNGETMSNYAKMFYDMGYNVLLPDDRAHGNSSGDYINFGWIDRLDFVEWAHSVINNVGEDSKIIMFGVSMGGATIQMTSGEKLPSQVKLLISDCGYSNLRSELAYLLKHQFHLSPTVFVPIINAINHHRMGFSIDDVSSVKQLRKNTRPFLFIHGEKDIYVPTYMVDECFEACPEPKDIWIVPNASHAESFWMNPKAYQAKIQRFIDNYSD